MSAVDQNQYAPQGQPSKSEAESKSTTSLVLGILAVVLGPIGVILGPIAIVQGKASEKLGGRATAGIVLGWIGTILAVFSIIFIIFTMITTAAALSSIDYSY